MNAAEQGFIRIFQVSKAYDASGGHGPEARLCWKM